LQAETIGPRAVGQFVAQRRGVFHYHRDGTSGGPAEPSGNFRWENDVPTLLKTLVLAVAACASAAQAAETPVEQPIATAKGRAGDLLRRWDAEGTAAGNAGDFYDNRDRGHSRLHLPLFPQVTPVAYSPEALQRRADWGMQRTVLPHVAFGNSSTSGNPVQNGSHVRTYYSDARGLRFLFTQYLHNNLYVYPEHVDHDPGHNGPRWGDLFPANTPYVVASQGSSGSDQPFVRAIAYTLAAFRPEVKRKLIRLRVLMPTFQMILRSTGRHLAGPEDYLTGKAHPSAFDARNLDTVKMVQLAHEIREDTIPPLVRLRVVEEDASRNGLDYFEPGKGERIADTPCAVARVVRGRAYRRRMVVSAEDSRDANGRPLAFHWAVLRGDAGRIRITPQNPAGSVAEVVVPYHARRPVAEGAELESNRVDIGVFAHNGAYYSAPAFLTFLSLDNEHRTYSDDGRILEIQYGAYSADLRVADWEAFFRLLEPGGESWATGLLRRQFTNAELAALLEAAGCHGNAVAEYADAGEKHKAASAALDRAKQKKDAAEEDYERAVGARERTFNEETKHAFRLADVRRSVAREVYRKAQRASRDARNELSRAKRTRDEALEESAPGAPGSLKQLVRSSLDELIQNPRFYLDGAAEIEAACADDEHRAALEKARGRLAKAGLLVEGEGGGLELRPLRQGPRPPEERLSRYERERLARFHAEVLSDALCPGVFRARYLRNFVDPRIAAQRSWRDVYHYDESGRCTGWTRYAKGAVTEFNADGFVILERDALGRCIRAGTVRYEAVREGAWRVSVRQARGDEIVEYAYDGDTDRTGHISKRGPIRPENGKEE